MIIKNNSKVKNPRGCHIPVLCEELIKGLAIKPDGFYVDGTFGRGGHSRAVLQQLGTEGKLLAVDKDFQAIEVAQSLPFSTDIRLMARQGCYSELPTLLATLSVEKKIDGIILDLGVSSPQLEEANRGFSFLQDGPLDMRMNPRIGMSAADWLAQATEQEITNVLWEYGEERYSRRIADAIVKQRTIEPLISTRQLAHLITTIVRKSDRHRHPATRSFQAIRIFINQELTILAAGLPLCWEILAKGGRLAVISFHSLEDRIVKQFIQTKTQVATSWPFDAPLPHAMRTLEAKKVCKLIRPTEREVIDNPRARSARLRIMEKLV